MGPPFKVTDEAKEMLRRRVTQASLDVVAPTLE